MESERRLVKSKFNIFDLTLSNLLVIMTRFVCDLPLVFANLF